MNRFIITALTFDTHERIWLEVDEWELADMQAHPEEQRFAIVAIEPLTDAANAAA